MKKPIPKDLATKLIKLGEYSRRVNKLESEIRHWLYINNYSPVMNDYLIDSIQSGDTSSLIAFLNGAENEYGDTVDSFYSDNSQINESDYI